MKLLGSTKRGFRLVCYVEESMAIPSICVIQGCVRFVYFLVQGSVKYQILRIRKSVPICTKNSINHWGCEAEIVPAAREAFM